MLYFIIPLRSKASSKNWDTVTDCFNKTLASCYNQTSKDFKIFVVCHDIPKINQTYDERVEFVQVNTPFPQNIKEMMNDKGYKIFTGMHHVRKSLNINDARGGYVMAVDADDLVSNELAGFFENKDDNRCFNSKYGYIWHRNSNWITKHLDLNRLCGSCCVIYYKREELPSMTFEECTANDKFLFQCSHIYLPSRAKEVGKGLSTIPFPTTIYVLDTGENNTAMRGLRLSKKRIIEGIIRIPKYITVKLRQTYNI